MYPSMSALFSESLTHYFTTNIRVFRSHKKELLIGSVPTRLPFFKEVRTLKNNEETTKSQFYLAKPFIKVSIEMPQINRATYL